MAATPANQGRGNTAENSQSTFNGSGPTFPSLEQIFPDYELHDDGTRSATLYDTANMELHSVLLVTYDVNWQVTDIVFNYDDGTHTLGSYDIANEHSHSEHLATFDSQQNLTRSIFINDDGTKWVVAYDTQNEYSWSWQRFEYDSSWNLIATHGVQDDGTAFGNPYSGPGEDAAQYAAAVLADAFHGTGAFREWFGDFEGSEDLGAPGAPVSAQNVGTGPSGEHDGPPAVVNRELNVLGENWDLV
jgi:hypothetical protein